MNFLMRNKDLFIIPINEGWANRAFIFLLEMIQYNKKRMRGSYDKTTTHY